MRGPPKRSRGVILTSLSLLPGFSRQLSAGYTTVGRRHLDQVFRTPAPSCHEHLTAWVALHPDDSSAHQRPQGPRQRQASVYRVYPIQGLPGAALLDSAILCANLLWACLVHLGFQVVL
ncbi:hypothetical protein NDU88_004301 [Pleurodeles waltl]|uniref:Secreted protein n=1 Tax=Pleurodeles waltl TaxID=8319 RepID=A0AAV7NJ65_PLEWA|nr:hypothetical protein NDU88_004301 [Pleurodeles waltl]